MPVEQKSLPETVRAYIAQCPQLAVKGGELSLDGLSPKGQSMSIQFNPGRAVKKYVDGTRIMRQPFTILYRARATRGNKDKSAMIGALNLIGEWMKKAGPPDLGPNFKARAFEQEDLANILEQDNDNVVYSATYALEYVTYS